MDRWPLQALRCLLSGPYFPGEHWRETVRLGIRCRWRFVLVYDGQCPVQNPILQTLKTLLRCTTTWWNAEGAKRNVTVLTELVAGARDSVFVTVGTSCYGTC